MRPCTALPEATRAPARPAQPRYRPRLRPTSWPLARLVAVAAALALTGVGCGGQATPTPPPPQPTRAAASPLPSPSPGPPTPVLVTTRPPLPSPSPAASPAAAAPSPSPSPAAATLSAQAFSVMVDNAPDARPHMGLGAADVLYETPAEAGIPRILAFYLRNAEVERIGPVRSVRHYYVYHAAEFRVPLVHIGYSPQALAALEQTATERIDESRGDGGFLRDPRRAAPHNAFVSSASVQQEMGRRGLSTRPTLGGLSFGFFRPGPQPATHVRIPYPCCIGYVATYEYDAANRVYRRFMDGQPHTDAGNGEHYAARSLIVQFAAVHAIPGDEAGRLEVGVVGSGRGLLIAEGTQAPLQWRKLSPRDATHFQREDGQPFSLPEGQVWIQVVPLEANVQVS